MNPIILMSLSSIARHQANQTKQTIDQVKHFLDYMLTHPEATIRYYKSTMILNAHSDAPYLTEPGARSRVAGHFLWQMHRRQTNPSY